MELLTVSLITFILGICIGNTTIRTKIVSEIKAILSKEKVDCPIKAEYVSKKANKQEGTSTKTSTTHGGCNKCGGPVEPIDKMPGYWFCVACNSITSKNKETVK